MKAASMQAKKATSENGVQASPVIFVVDDEPMLLELASAILKPLGFEVETFRDPRAAVTAFAEAEPAPVLVITDYSMHQMNGLEMIGAFRKVNPKQKVLMVSGTVDEHIYRHANAKQKPNQFLAKPYENSGVICNT